MQEEISEKELLELLEGRIMALKSKLKRAEEALIAFKGKSITGNTEKGNKKVEPPSLYDISYKWDKKLLFVLSKKGAAYKDDIVKEISRLEPKANLDKLINLIGVKLSALLKQGIIKAEREGRRFKYQIP